MNSLIRSKRHGRIRFPKDCEPGTPYSEIIDEKGNRVPNCPTSLSELLTLHYPSKNTAPYSEELLHNIKLRPLINSFLPFISSKMMNLPSTYLATQEKQLETIEHIDLLIVGGGSAGLSALPESKNSLLITFDVLGDIFYDSSPIPEVDYKQLLSELKDVVKNNQEKILEGKYMGRFEEGILLETKNKIILIKNVNKIMFATGARYIPPIMDRNDLPGLISRNMFIRLLQKSSSKLDKIIIIGSSNDAIRTALLAVSKGSKAKVLYKRGTKLFSKFYLEKAEENGIDLIPVNYAKVLGDSYVNGIEYDGIVENTRIVVYSIIKQPRLEAVANYYDDYVFLLSAHIYVPKHNIYGKYNENVMIAGGLRGISDHYTSYISGKLAMDESKYVDEIKRRIQNYEGYLMQLYNDMPSTKIQSPYLYSEGGYICECEDITYSDVINAIRMEYNTVEDIKRITGICTGECQGRYCAYLVGSITESKKLITFRSPLFSLVI